MTTEQTRQIQFENWLKANLPNEIVALVPLPGDASFRHYFRLEGHPGWLAVDAPPEHEKTVEFVRVAQAYADIGVHVPQIMAYNTTLGFLIVSDLGDTSYLQALTASPDRADTLYSDALLSLVQITRCTPCAALPLDHFDAQFMRNELNFFTQWFLRDYLKITITPELQTLLDDTYAKLIKRAENQKQVCIHRDYHSRNLIVCESGKNPGVIDFQDAMMGPITYDCVSLLRDAYIALPKDQVISLARFFYDNVRDAHDDYRTSFEEFYHDFQWMGMQRHLKAIFIFARKFLRDNNPNYLGDIPRTLEYVRQVAKEDEAFNAFSEFIELEVVPRVRSCA
ncbi:MAG: aminoglycoside phosphotransferase family protein [Gammaproteobacteria bacterium]